MSSSPEYASLADSFIIVLRASLKVAGTAITTFVNGEASFICDISTFFHLTIIRSRNLKKYIYYKIVLTLDHLNKDLRIRVITSTGEINLSSEPYGTL